jgi:hypothetical protein
MRRDGSSEAYQCPHCKTGSYGIQGVKCTVCGGLLKFSEAHRIDRFEENTDFFHNSCYQKVSQIVEKKKTINCPACTHPNQFSYATNRRNNFSAFHYGERVTCANCGHPYEYKQLEANDPYTGCMYCKFLLEKHLEVHIETQGYAHKVCYTHERQARELERKEYKENSEKKMNEERLKIEIKKAHKNLEEIINITLLPVLFIGGISVYSGGFWGSLLFGIFFALYIIFIVVELLMSNKPR